MKKIYIISGLAGPIIYLLAIILGSFLQPGYDQVLRTVSYLNAIGASHKVFFDIIFLIDNLLLIIFAVGLFFSFNNINLKLGAVILKLVALFNIILILFFPIYSNNLTIGTTNSTHQSIVNLIAVLTIFAIFFVSLGLWKINYFKSSRSYMVLTLIVIILAWIITAWAIYSVSPIRGLIEKIAIFIFLQWIFIVALKFYKLNINYGAKSERFITAE